MTFDEYKNSGKSGWYCAERDEWFLDGEEPPPIKIKVKAPEPELKTEPAEPKAAEKPTKSGKSNV